MQNLLLLFLLITTFYSCKTDNPSPHIIESPIPLSHQVGLRKSLQHLEEWKESRVASQFFTIEVAKDTILVSNKGSWLVVPAHNFVDEKGKLLKGAVQLELVEVHTVAEAMQTGLSTLTLDQQPLETAGMFFMNVTSKAAAQVQYKKPIQLHTHTNVVLPNLQLFEGKWVGNQLLWDNPQPVAKTMTKIPYEWVLAANKSRQQGYKDESECVERGYYSKLTQTPPAYYADCPMYYIYTKMQGRDSLFRDTWVSTEDFIVRKKYIMQSCLLEPFTIYINNLDKPLWQADALVADYLEEEGNSMAANFKKLAKLKKTVCIKINYTDQQLADLKDFQNELNEVTKKVNTARALDYPNRIEIIENGWLNLDCYFINDEWAEAEKIDLKLDVTTQYQNIPSEVQLNAFFVAENWNNMIMINKEENSYEAYYHNMIKNKSFLIFVQDKAKKYTGVYEGRADKELIQTTITVQPTTAAHEAIIASYMQVPDRAKLVEDKEAVCCEGWDLGADSE